MSVEFNWAGKKYITRKTPTNDLSRSVFGAIKERGKIPDEKGEIDKSNDVLTRANEKDMKLYRDET